MYNKNVQQLKKKSNTCIKGAEFKQTGVLNNIYIVKLQALLSELSHFIDDMMDDALSVENILICFRLSLLH